MTDFFTRKKNENNITLNDVQQKAVLQTEGPLLLLSMSRVGENNNNDYANRLFDRGAACRSETY